MNLGGTVHLNKNFFIILFVAIVTLLILYRNSSIHTDHTNVPTKVELRTLLSAAIDAAKRGGKKVKAVRDAATLNEQSKGQTLEGANNPITDGDMQSHMEMFYSIQNAFPGIKVISEEKPKVAASDTSHIKEADIALSEIESLDLPINVVNSADVRIWIDPLDATQEYTEKLLQYITTMICVAVKGEPVIGVIHKPFEDYTAWAYGDKISPSLKIAKDQGVAGDNVRIIVSRSHKGKVEEVAKEAFGMHANITGAGGAGYKTLEVVGGSNDVYVHTTLIKKWDICAGNALLNALHGKMTTLKGDIIQYGSAEDYKNADGLLAALYHHQEYLEKLSALQQS